jgi:uncharacterized delta-60 repeat protein
VRATHGRFPGRRSPCRTLVLLGGAVGLLVTSAGPAHAAPGELDPGFGSGGVVRTTLGHPSFARGAALDQGDRIVVAGTESDFGLAVGRYLSDGSPDTDFDGDGIATTQLAGFQNLDAIDVALDAQRRPVVLARAYDTGSFASVSVVARYTTMGALDTGFGSGGRVVVPGVSSPSGIGLQSDGRIVIGGASATAFTGVRLSGTDGAVDGTYGTGGAATLTFAGDATSSSYANDALVDGAGRLVIAATISHGAGAQRYAVVRFTAAGQPDAAFDGDGLVETPFSGGNASTNAIATAPGDQLVVAGDANDNTTFGVARYNDDGALDTSFDADGLVTTAIPGHANASATAVHVGADGRVNVAGYGRNGTTPAFVLVRYLAGGSPDSASTGGGFTTTALNGHASALVGQAGGRLVGAGFSTPAGAASQIILIGYQNAGTSPHSPPPDFVPAPPVRFVAPPPPLLWRIQGIEVTQGSQVTGVPQPNQSGGSFSVRYRGVKLARGGRTLARVFVDSQVPVHVTVTGYDTAGTRLGTATANPSLIPVDHSSRDVNTKQQLFFGGFQVEIPSAWARRTLRLVAHVVPQNNDTCSRRECGDVTLTNIAFTPVRPVKVRLVALLDNGKYPPYSAEAIRRALSLAPQGDTPIDVPLFYAGTLEIGDLKIGTTTCTFGFWCKFRTREDTNPASLERLQDWDEANRPRKSSDIDITIGVSGDSAIGISNGASVFPFLGLPQLCSIGGIGSLFTCTRPVVAVSEADASFLDKGRPLTNAGHELFHALGRPHASKACGGGGGGLLNNMGEDWPTDQTGRLNGVGLDFSRLAGQIPIPFMPPGFGAFYDVIPPQTSTAYQGGSDVGQTDYIYDLMSYCGSPLGNGDPYSWLSPKNWDAVMDKLSTGKAGTRAALRTAAAGIAVTAAPTGPRMQVDAIQTASGTAVTNLADTTGRTAAVADPAKAPHVVFRDATGRTLSDTPMETRVTHGDASGGARPVTFMRALAPRPPGGVKSVSIVDDGKVLDVRERSAHPPTVTAVSAGRGSFTKRMRFTLRWRSGDRDADRRQVTVAYAPDGRTFKTIHIGADRGRATLLTEVLTPGLRARFKVTVDDGFDRASALSRRVKVGARPPRIGIFGLPPGRKLVPGQRLVLRGQGSETGGSLVPNLRLRWYVGRKLAARGPELRIVMPAKGNLKLRLQARGASGLTGSAAVTIRPGKKP